MTTPTDRTFNVWVLDSLLRLLQCFKWPFKVWSRHFNYRRKYWCTQFAMPVILYIKDCEIHQFLDSLKIFSLLANINTCLGKNVQFLITSMLNQSYCLHPLSKFFPYTLIIFRENSTFLQEGMRMNSFTKKFPLNIICNRH